MSDDQEPKATATVADTNHKLDKVDDKSSSNSNNGDEVLEANNKNLVNDKPENDMMSSLASRLQLLEKRLKGRVETSEEVDISCDTQTDVPQMNIIKAFSLSDKKPIVKNDENSVTISDVTSASESPVAPKDDTDDKEKDSPNISMDAVKAEKEDTSNDGVKQNDKSGDSSAAVEKENCDDDLMECSDNAMNNTENESENIEPVNVKMETSDSDTKVNDEKVIDDSDIKSEEISNVDNMSETKLSGNVFDLIEKKKSETFHKDEETAVNEKLDNDTDKAKNSDESNGSETAVGDQNSKSDVKDIDALKKGKGIDAIARMLRKQQKGTETVKSDDTEVKSLDDKAADGEKISKELNDASEQSSTEPSKPKSNDDEPMEVDTLTKPKETEGGESTEKKESSANSKRMKTCKECQVFKVCKFQVMMQGPTKLIRTHLCDNKCYSAFREKQKQQRQAAKSASAKLSSGDTCAICQKDMKDLVSVVPSISADRLVICSQGCFKKYQINEGPKRTCGHCKEVITKPVERLTWETMEFCSEECLGNYQNMMGSHCACCNNAVISSSLGKFCVRFGSDIKQFCTNTCLEDFKKGLKVCTFCQKDISNGVEGFLAAVGDKGQFKDFCSQQCMEKYDVMNNPSSTTPKTVHCDACKKLRPSKIELDHGGKSQSLCSELCYVAFKHANKICKDKCDQCHKFLGGDDEEMTIHVDGIGKRFCSKMCLNIFVLSYRKIVPCSWCKVKKYNFDMIEMANSNGAVQLFCSLNCLSTFRVNKNTASSRSIKCDFCSKMTPAQYHLTMSDASVRNFCSYNCVAKFQNQYQKVGDGASATKNIQSASNQTRKSSSQQSSITQQQNSNRASSNVITLKNIPNLNSMKVLQTSPITIPKVPNPAKLQQSSSASNNGSTTVIVRPPPPKLLKNKGTLCKPITMTKGVTCHPLPSHKDTQTDGECKNGETKYVPIPVPIYIPMPMHMYSMPTPVPLPIPIPIPVPVFIPTTKNSAEEIMASIKEIKEKFPQDPYEADLLVMAEMVAGNDPGGSKKLAITDDNANADVDADAASTTSTQESVETYDVEKILEAGSGSQADQCEQNGDQDSLKRPADGADTDKPPNKRIKLDNSSADNSSISLDMTTNLKYKFGVNAWKNWVMKKNEQLENASQTNNRKLKLFKTDILQLSADELNYSLCLFVKEVRSPSGSEYSADSIYYLCLGIQQYLFLNNRVDNILTDGSFEKFTECLNDALHSYESTLLARNAFLPRINAEILWESRQLGAHSPHVLLNTLLYYNTKYFGLRTVDDHFKVSFSLVVKQGKKTGKSNMASLKYYSPAPQINQPMKAGQKRKKEYLEQLENKDNPLRCPVKLYEFYLLKCPESIKSRSDVYYLNPERSCVPDSPVWYSTQALGREQLGKMLQRAKMIKDIFD